LFAAPAFVVVHDLGLWQSVRASAALLRRLPFAVPLAVAVIAIPHVPGLVLRTPALRAGAATDPDWIVYALLAQLPAQALGSCLAAGLATYLALRTREHRPRERARGLRPAVATTAALVALVTTGCDETARTLSLRFACERWVERARLRADGLRESDTPPDSLAWLQVAGLYGRTVERLEVARPSALAGGAAVGIERDLGRLACKARIGRADAWARAGRLEPARADYARVIAQTTYRGARSDAAIGLGRCEDRAQNWDAAFAAYRDWLDGIATGTWPLHANGLDAPAYVARRLADRGATAVREQWIDSAAQAFETAAARGELAREARMARFALLLAAARWDAAYAALHQLRALHDPQGRDGALVVAEASLLAGGMRRDDAALGVLRPLHAEQSPFDGQHRVAGWLLAGNIHQRRGENVAASAAFEQAVGGARSDAGRSEATLGLARVCGARGDLEAARRYYTQLRDVWPATPAGLVAPLEEIQLLRAHGQDAEVDALVPVAQRSYQGVIQRFGTERPALVAARCLGETYGLEGQWDRSVTFLENASAGFGQDPSAGTLLVHAARLAADKLHDERRAAELLDRLASRFPNSDQAIMARGLADSLSVRSR
jgi:tetratricopeptide (TPR) repeat protein